MRTLCENRHGALYFHCYTMCKVCLSCLDTEEPLEGRLGSSDVQFHFDIHTNVGTLIVDQDRLGVSYRNNNF